MFTDKVMQESNLHKNAFESSNLLRGFYETATRNLKVELDEFIANEAKLAD